MTSDLVTYYSQLAAEECWALIAEAEVGRIAWQGPLGVTVLPVNFSISGRTIIFHTAPKSSIAELAESTEVAFQVDDIDPEAAHGWSVLVRGQSRAANAEADNVSWLHTGETVSIAIDASDITGRVVSGTQQRHEEAPDGE